MDLITPFLVKVINTNQPITMMVFCMNVADECSKNGPEMQRAGR